MVNWPWPILCLGLIFRQSLPSWSQDVYKRSRLYIFQALSPIGFSFILFDWVILGLWPGTETPWLARSESYVLHFEGAKTIGSRWNESRLGWFPRGILGCGYQRRVNGYWAAKQPPDPEEDVLTYIQDIGSPYYGYRVDQELVVL